ncbi:MAG: transposase [Gammaproteobacteria bacterium]
MWNDTLQLTDQKVLHYAEELLEANLPLEADGYCCTTADLLDVLLAVAVNQGTVESVCADLMGTPDPETIRRYFNEQLVVDDLAQLEQGFNAALAAQIPSRVKRRRCELAIDFHDRPDSGKSPQAQGLWVRGKAKDGTTRFYRVATAYVMLRHTRFTLAVRFVLPEEDTVTVLDDMLEQVRKTLRIRVKVLTLDRGFDTAVMAYLTRLRQPAVIACTLRGKTGGTRALYQGRGSYRTRHTFCRRQAGEFTADVAVCRLYSSAKRTGRHPPQAGWMVFVVIRLNWSPQQARRQYRRRFGIEGSYRCAGQVRGWTTSPNPALRFVLIGLSFVLLNVWVYLRALFTQVPRRGGRWLDTKRFQLNRLASSSFVPSSNTTDALMTLLR